MATTSKPFLWTVMVYLAGDNNLTDESVFALTEMKQVNTDDRIAVIAQLDPGGSIPSHRYVINRGPAARGVNLPPGPRTIAFDAIPIKEPKIKFPVAAGLSTRAPRAETDSGETDTGDPATLFDFISWTQEHYGAERYMLILAGHGAGTEEDFLMRDETTLAQKGIRPSNPTSSLSMRELRSVLKEVNENEELQKIDILGMDVCLMSMVEVCYELNGSVDYLVSSESYSPTAGWPYRQILEKIDAALQKNKLASPEELAKIIVGEYIGFYNDYIVGGLSVDQSVLEVSASEGVALAVKNLAQDIQKRLTSKPLKDGLILAHWEAQSYNGELFVDLMDFCERLAERCPEANEASLKVMEAIRKLVRKSCFTGVENQFSNGVSIYFPWADVAPSYEQLAFAEKAGWNSFLQAYVQETRRKPREFKDGDELLLEFPGARPFKFESVVLGSERFRKAGERKAGERGSINPVHSMRNPPVTVVSKGLSECIQGTPSAVDSVKNFARIGEPKERG
jgi:hypothetical protein